MREAEIGTSVRSKDWRTHEIAVFKPTDSQASYCRVYFGDHYKLFDAETLLTAIMHSTFVESDKDCLIIYQISGETLEILITCDQLQKLKKALEEICSPHRAAEKSVEPSSSATPFERMLEVVFKLLHSQFGRTMLDLLSRW